MKPVEQGFKHYWISQMNLSQNEDFICEDLERTKHFPDCVFHEVVEIAALNAEKEKVKELLNAIKGIQVQTELFNFAKDEIRVRTANDIAFAALEKYGASID